MSNAAAAEMPTKTHTNRYKQIGVAFFLAVVIAISWVLGTTLGWMLDDEQLPLSQLVVKGELHYTQPQDVQKALSIIPHVGTFMSQDVDELQNALIALPWVAQVSIRKQWPETVKVFLVEHQPLAVWNGISLLNSHGDVFQGDVADLEREAVKLYGPQGSNHQVVDAWKQIDSMLKPLGLETSSLVLNERRAWQVILSNGIRLELGKEALPERIERFALLYKKLGGKVETISHIDLRYDTGAAVGWFPEQDLAQERAND
ncbi:cell division protein FtsQ/DivIB [Vibrio sp. SCSIO 43136]|uniref:cell division protein FtsQ/DivIB n=1 Tax=Vibrio sp. SCSIO 43136 TaxID=2819101 RepID=UPI002075152E|nr:cell division protein FtsQ/DivIB [Vibrio sp. SCSIO 43136]USD64865.1 cell division protein FtsQ/DivIB [Vibrio sp. SCSIO 43136]